LLKPQDVLGKVHGFWGSPFPNYRRGRLRRRASGLRALPVGRRFLPAPPP
jgi:hypothetical protein